MPYGSKWLYSAAAVGPIVVIEAVTNFIETVTLFFHVIFSSVCCGLSGEKKESYGTTEYIIVLLLVTYLLNKSLLMLWKQSCMDREAKKGYEGRILLVSLALIDA